MKKLNLLFIILITPFFSINCFSQVTIAKQSFDGDPSDNLSYTVSNASLVSTSNTMSVSPINSLRFTGTSNSNTNADFSNINITSYSNVEVFISFASTNVDGNEDLFIDFSYNNGSSYTSVQLIDGNSNKSIAFGTGDSSPGQSANPYIFSVPSGKTSLTIRVRSRGLESNEYFYIDDLEIRGIFIPPSIVLQGNSTIITNGDITPSTTDLTDFGAFSIVNETYTVTYIIKNEGPGFLTPGAITFSGAGASSFALLNSPASIINPGYSTSFDVIFDPSTIGPKTATISIASNDPVNSIYTFDITGLGTYIDTDGDGVTDSVDLDDDNDGILDTTEAGTCISDPFVNGSFETTTPLLPATSYIITPDANVPGWQSTEGKIEIWSTGFNGVPAALGNQFAELNANVPGTLYQTFCLSGASGTVKWSIKHRGRSGVDQAFVKFGETLAKAQASTPIVTMVDGNTAWGTYSGVYTIPLGQTQIVLAFQSGYTASGSPSIGNFVDDIQITITQGTVDTDRDGIANVFDIDDDNDGIPDIEEAGFKMYSNNTSTFDMSSGATWSDTNGNGMNDYIDALIAAGTYSIPDTDGDGVPDYIDLDSDNDSLFDIDEAGLLNGDGDINGDGVGEGSDTDKDGLLNIYDNSGIFGTSYRAYALDSDSDGTPDYLEIDSDNNGIYDIATTLYNSADANNDGLIDGIIDIDKDGIIDTFDTNTAYWGSPRDLNRKLFLDFDGRNDYGQDAPILGGLASASLMAWIDLNNSFSSNGVIVGQNNFKIQISSARKLQAILNGTTLTYNTILEKSHWYHVGAVYDGSVLKLFVNGEMVASTSASGNIAADTTLLTIGKNPSSNTNYFKGKIDEVRVFNVALTDSQFQRMVYQEIQNTSGQVAGAIVPKDIGTLPFANLLRYYRMDVYKDDIIDDLTTPTIDTGVGMKIYNHKIISYQQAPLPFETIRNGDFATSVDNPALDIVGLDVIQKEWCIIKVKHNITQTSNHTQLAMFVEPGVTITMNNDTKLQNDWYLKLDGKIDLVGQSQFLQTSNSDLDISSSGVIERDQKGQSNKFNYNYWCSPVGAISTLTNNTPSTVNGNMKDGTNPNNPQNISWTSSQNASPTSPITLSKLWIYKFQNATPEYANWAYVGPNGSLNAGEGYTLKGSGTASANQNYTFIGKPNNGTITLPVSAENLNLCGNPYASALDADKFILDNITAIDGTIRFWEHYSTNNTHVLLDYQGGYATRTLVGGTPPVTPVGLSTEGSSTRVPGRYIPVGQGFFVTGSDIGGTITFNNSQRVFIKENNASSNFTFKSVSNNSISNPEDTILEEQFTKLRLGFTSSNNYHRQILIGFMNENATAEIDKGYDAIIKDEEPIEMYFLKGTSKLNILGEGYFDVYNTFPLGIKNVTAGKIKIGLDVKENFDESLDIYIYDNLLNHYHSIKSEDYEIEVPAGTIDDRFTLKFTTSSKLDVAENELQNSIKINHYQYNNTLIIENNSQNTTIKDVILFNMLGQKILMWDMTDSNQLYTSLNNLTSGTYIVKTNTNQGAVSQKIIIR